MRHPEFVEIDPRELHLLPSQASGADPFKLQMQIARYGSSQRGMPRPWDDRGTDGGLVLYNGVTRATRIARLAPGSLIQVEVIGNLKRPVRRFPTIGGTLP